MNIMNQSMAPRISGIRPSGGSLCGHRLLGLSDHWAARRLGRGRPVALHRAERGGARERRLDLRHWRPGFNC